MERKFVLRILTVFLVFCFFINVGQPVLVSAEVNNENMDEPDFSLKLINNGTGVKMTINKTKGADGYYIHLMETDTPYTEYRYDSNLAILLKKLEQDGKKKRTFVINGLPEGVYTFRIASYRNKEYYEDPVVNFSEEKSITVKACKTVERQEKEYNFTDVKVGDVIKFGAYEQDDDMNNGKEDIEWIVLSKTDSKMLVMSKYVLDALSYNKRDEKTSWETCTLRKWLNEYFYDNAFTKREKAMIKKSKIKNLGNPYLENTIDGKTTKDKVFLLSIQEVTNKKYGFKKDFLADDPLRYGYPTDYAIAKGAPAIITDDLEFPQEKGTCNWWLRTIGNTPRNAADVGYEGHAIYSGYGEWVGDEFVQIWRCSTLVRSSRVGVRPVLYIDLQK